LKLVGFGLRNYVKHGFNNFDAIIVLISLTEMIISFFIRSEGVLEVLNLFKAFRALRMLKLARYN